MVDCSEIFGLQVVFINKRLKWHGNTGACSLSYQVWPGQMHERRNCTDFQIQLALLMFSRWNRHDHNHCISTLSMRIFETFCQHPSFVKTVPSAGLSQKEVLGQREVKQSSSLCSKYKSLIHHRTTTKYNPISLLKSDHYLPDGLSVLWSLKVHPCIFFFFFLLQSAVLDVGMFHLYFSETQILSVFMFSNVFPRCLL